LVTNTDSFHTDACWCHGNLAQHAWVETHASQVELSTRIEYEQSANQLRARLGRISLEELTKLEVQRYANAQRKTLLASHKAASFGRQVEQWLAC
jgi:hypothetical protein